MSQSVVTNYFGKKRRGGYVQPSKRLKLSQDSSIEAVDKSLSKNELIIQPDKIVEQIRKAKTRSSCRKKTGTQEPAITRKSGRTLRKPEIQEKRSSLDEYFCQNLPPVTESLDEITLHLSPSSKTSSLCGSERDLNEVVTAAEDDHDSPSSPSKRQKVMEKREMMARQKRGRVTPKKKLAYEFKVAEKSVEETLTPIIDFTTRRRAKKQLVMAQETDDKAKNIAASSDIIEKKVINTVKAPEKSKDSVVEKEKQKTSARNNKSKEIGQNEVQKRTRRNKGTTEEAGTSDTMKKSEILAKKLLAKKMESPDTVKEALKSSNKLKDLQDTLMKMRDQKKKSQERERMKKAKEGKQKKKDETKSEKKSVSKREFAYETLHNLAQEVPKGLPLPFKYKILEEMFRGTDTVVSMMFNRQQNTTWSTLQKSVKEMIRKNFELSNLEQIKFLFPAAYLYRQEKGILSYNSGNIRPSDYQLTLEPILDERECEQFGNEPRKLTSSMLVKRRHHFLVQLISVVKQHHKKFLSSLEPPIEVPDDKILRWHPQFPLDKIPDIETSELPKPPNHDKDKCSSAKDVLDKARAKFTKKAVDALKKVAERASMTPEKKRTIDEENNNLTPKKSPEIKPAPSLKGIPKSLLTKIRAKEAEKKLKTMIRTNEEETKLAKLMKSSDIARALRMLFVTEKKAALPLEYINERLVKCTAGIQVQHVVEEHVLLLVELIPTWLSVAKVRGKSYIKMNKSKEIANVVQDIQEKIKEIENA